MTDLSGKCLGIGEGLTVVTHSVIDDEAYLGDTYSIVSHWVALFVSALVEGHSKAMLR